uniref:Exodeoxyribonuclease III Xth n=1 Tax=Rhodopseudomonas palustris (strain BisA53) TaxID=316055 RepID=Q07KF7_RHOP5
MKIATFNINNINNRLPSLLAWLKSAKPDAVCLQELKTEQHKFPEKALRDAGYSAVWVGQKSWNGVAILSKKNPVVVIRTRLPGDPTDSEARYVEGAVGGVVIACLYAPNGNPQPGPKFDRKLAWMKRLHKHAGSLLKSGAPVVIAGDFNVAPTELDIYPTKSWNKDALIQPESRNAYAKLVGQGWTDAIRSLHPEQRIYSFWTYWRNRFERDDGLRLDHLLLSPDVAPRLVKAGVDRAVRARDGASDHAPVWIVLK